ncbi:MAG: hypothetical protein ONB46_22965 [candidate division KSB1 bacterium]|nr:hypothetical protein [candidate division KSB1 bacterium]MDZ7368719.1 hypothetical protein [candidate division KSB1 bacterium]MDZ7406540.1 hypothetical protein [candidate division KSB1 bacterium]
METNASNPALPPQRWPPIFVGGAVIAGAENFPGLSLLDWLCCGTIWSGALLAVYLVWRQNPQRGVTFNEAISTGIFAALLGAVLNFAIDYTFKKPLTDVLRFLGETTELSGKLREYLPQGIFEPMPILLHAIYFLMSAIVHAIIGAIGGMIGAAIFPPRKKDAADPPAF